MKTRLFAVMTAVLVLCSVASAQGYSIRVTYDTNLRAAASLSGTIVETASSGTALQVVGNANRWLKINRNGSEVWMANWVSYTRVEGSAQTPSQVASNIDNCCFVDRLCTSDQEMEGRVLGIPEQSMRRAFTISAANIIAARQQQSQRKLIIAASSTGNAIRMRNG